MAGAPPPAASPPRPPGGAGPGTWLVALLYGFLLRCPVCHRGAIFEQPWPWKYRMNERCPVCGVRFMPDKGEITGGMAMTMVLTSILGVPAAIYLALFTTLSTPWLVGWLVGVPTLFGLWFYRHAQGLWVAVLYLTRSMEESHPAARGHRSPAGARDRAGGAGGGDPGRTSAGPQPAGPRSTRDGQRRP
ncbi:MAG TPA: DUF983 domain-containing protein [Chloroflexota bacterium]|nr:DUF983 domain-containing protein [Chloroflexota bacterium]